MPPASPRGETHDVEILGHSATAGRATQARLEATRELDIVIAKKDSKNVDIGWWVTGPVG